MKSNTYELHNYADLSLSTPAMSKESPRKRKASQHPSNSRRNEKYSLRQQRRNAARQSNDELPADAPTASELPTLPASCPAAATATAAAAAAAALPASIVSTTSRTASSGTATRNKAAPKAKTKAAPLSKYRRKTANARERTRMREINMAFEHLRHCVPQAITGEEAANANEKLTKITTLRLAMKYIGMLTDALEDPSYQSDFIVECLHESACREEFNHNSSSSMDVPVNEAPPASKTPKKTSNKATSNSSKKTAPAKRNSSKKVKTAKVVSSRSPESCYASSSIGSPGSCAAASSPSSAYASLSSSSDQLDADAHSLLGMQALSELNTLLQESDGESLPLSEHCLSPSYQSLLTPHDTVLPMSSLSSSLDKADVELSLRLLDSSADSFDFGGSEQQPSACMSPLASLDSFHPFNDLLHTDFPEPIALDLFLT